MMKDKCKSRYYLVFLILSIFFSGNLYGYYEEDPFKRTLKQVRHGSMEDVRSRYEEKSDQFIEAGKELDEIKGIQDKNYKKLMTHLKAVPEKKKMGMKSKIDKAKMLHKEFNKKYSNAKDTLKWKDSLVKARRDVEKAKTVHNKFLKHKKMLMAHDVLPKDIIIHKPAKMNHMEQMHDSAKSVHDSAKNTMMDAGY